ncbi:MAG: c-type cytochrome [Chloroflexi bacterium]|nr:c-type cytochrome [Chloroflexota bacterium]
MKRFVTTLSQLQINIVGLLLIVLVSTVWSWQASLFGSPQDIVIDIPRGTAEQIARGEENDVIPDLIRLNQGDSLVLINQDLDGHRVGGLFVNEASTVRAKFNEAGSFSYFCSVHPSGQTVFEVAQKSSALPLGWTLFAMVGLLGVINGLFLGGVSTFESTSMVAIGAVAILAGVVLAVNSSVLTGGNGIIGNNPISPTQDSVIRGTETYLQFCSTCHGESTGGDGPLAVGLDPPPADLVIHVPLHPDNVLYQFVQEGIPGSSMPPLGAAISKEETWHLVNYLRTLE